MDLGFLSLILELCDICDLANEIPNKLNGLTKLNIPVGQRNDTHQLSEVGVTCSSDQQAIGLTAFLRSERPQPGSTSIAPQHGFGGLDRQSHAAFGIAALTANINFR